MVVHLISLIPLREQGEQFTVKEVIENCYRILKKRIKAMKFLLEEENKDFMMLVYTGIDMMSHQLIDKICSEDESEAVWATEEMRKYVSEHHK